MSKIRAYYSTAQTVRTLMSSAAFDLYISNDPDFWMSTHGNTDYALLFVNGDDRDHTKISNQAGVKTADFDDIRADVNNNTIAENALITKAVNNIPGLDYTDFIDIFTVKGVLNVIIQHLQPGHCSLSFDNPPSKSGTFTDDFTGTDGQELSGRTGWTLAKDGLYNGEILGNALEAENNGGGGGLAYYTCTDQGSADQYVQAVDKHFVSTDDDLFLAVRLVDEDNFIAYHITGTGSAGARLCKFVSGSLTDSIITTQGGTDYGFKVECEGTTIRLFRDTGGGFTQVGSDQTITDHQTETSAGLVMGQVSDLAKWDDFENGLVGAPPSTGNPWYYYAQQAA